MSGSAALERQLDELRHVGSVDRPTVTGRAGGVSGGSEVQFTVKTADNVLQQVRYRAFGGLGLIGGCELWARRCEKSPLNALPPAEPVEWLAQLELPREYLADMLVVEDAWRDVLAQLVTQ
ncbi:MAG: hypothetical protein AAF270_12560 [Pseudomonadota bacterium]